jgi:glucose-6-phosphate dehydrogenase assembly protein OpcA
MTATAEQVVRATVPLREVERELGRQMKALHGSGEGPVRRVRMSNLVIYCDSQALAEQVDATIPEVLAVHPARVLLLVNEGVTAGPTGSADSALTATVTVRRLGHGENLGFSEQVTLRTGPGAVAHLPFAMRELLIGDLPTNLWWAAPVPPALAGPLVYELGEYAQQIIYDSIGWADPARGVAATAAWLEQVEHFEDVTRWRVASDLSWRRLKYWRRFLTQALDPASAPGSADSVTEILIEHGPHAVVSAWEVASWLVSWLGWRLDSGKAQPGTEMAWQFHNSRGLGRVRIVRLEKGPSDVRRVHITCRIQGRHGGLNLTAEDNQRLSLQLEGVEGAARTMTLPPRSPAEQIGRQLSDRARDPAFRVSMIVARLMAQSVLH